MLRIEVQGSLALVRLELQPGNGIVHRGRQVVNRFLSIDRPPARQRPRSTPHRDQGHRENHRRTQRLA